MKCEYCGTEITIKNFEMHTSGDCIKKCPKCGSNVEKRGEGIYCVNYPECNFYKKGRLSPTELQYLIDKYIKFKD